jgi:Ca2+-binding EF-hand superfamily protein
MKSFLVAISALGVAAAGNAQVSPPVSSPPPLIVPQQAPPPGMAMQRDQSRQEAQQRADRLFQMLDANRDGTVTRTEADQALAQFQAARGDDEAHGGNRMERMIDRAFGSATSLTLQQFEAQALAQFDRMDINHDGTLTAAERQQGRAQRPGQ